MVHGRIALTQPALVRGEVQLNPPDARPCVPPDQIRRDGEPHRGPLLLLLAKLSLGFGLWSLLLLVFVGAAILDSHEPLVYLIVLPFCGGGLVLALTTEGRARRDLARMASGDVDPRGAVATTEAVSFARYGALLNAFWLLILLVVSCFAAAF